MIMNSTDLYRELTDAAYDAPHWLRTLADIGTEGGILLLMAVAVLGWWRARSGTAHQVALAVLVPIATAVAYVLSELVKSVVDEERPCRAVAGAAASIAACPPEGDWSFPSNHSTIAAALAVGIAVAWRAALWPALPVALLTASPGCSSASTIRTMWRPASRWGRRWRHSARRCSAAR